MISSPKPQDLQKIARDFRLFSKAFLKIQDKTDTLIPFAMNALQIRYLANRTPRDLILKPRQIGFSTAIQAEIFRYSTTRPTRSLTLADDDVNTQKLRRMQDKFYDNLPDGFKPTRSISNARLTIYPEYNSEVMIGTAGNTNVGRAGSYRIQHYSEIAFYKDAENIMKSALQGGKPFWVVAESTPNGAQGYFYERCMEALRGEGIWKLHFFTWFDYIEYQLPLEPNEVLRYSDEEKDLIAKHGLSAEQIKWRRDKIGELGIDGFTQEYPEDPETCFLVSGRGVFQLDKPKLFTPCHEDRAIIGFPVSVAADYTATDDSVHVMGIDWGMSPDSTAVSIWDSTTYRKVAQYITGKRDYEYIIGDIVQLAQHYNVRYIVPEKNSMRMQVSFLVKAIATAFAETPAPRISPFNMDNKRKDDLVKLFQQGINEGLQLLDEPISKHELRTFEASQTPSGLWTYSHPSNGHDDTVVADMLAHLATFQLRDKIN